MGGIEIAIIVILVFSVICFAASFCVPDKKQEGSGIDKELAMQEVHEMVEKEMENVREPLNEIATEYVQYAYDGAAKNIDDLTNEKMFELTGYSDKVLREIKKEEEDLVMLHQVMKDEGDNLRKTVTAAGKAAKVMQDSIHAPGGGILWGWQRKDRPHGFRSQ